jgi:predicted Fe-S protein YdhL (DUF1289 family)
MSDHRCDGYEICAGCGVSISPDMVEDHILCHGCARQLQRCGISWNDNQDTDHVMSTVTNRSIALPCELSWKPNRTSPSFPLRGGSRTGYNSISMALHHPDTPRVGRVLPLDQTACGTIDSERFAAMKNIFGWQRGNFGNRVQLTGGEGR